MGWTWTTINGSAKKAIGILNNPLYVGLLVWNRSRKVRDPETGKRLMRMRPPEEWITTEIPERRIVSKALGDRVPQRRAGRRVIVRGHVVGHRLKYLFSGLLVCGTCGSAYTIESGKYYGCAAHRNRGPMVCQNNRQVHRVRLEEALLRLVFEEVFSPEVVRPLTRKIETALRRSMAAQLNPRDLLQAELVHARTQLQNVKQAIQGILTPTTREMLETCERGIADLEAQLRTPSKRTAPVSLASVVQAYLGDLRATLGTDVEAARLLLGKLIGKVTLHQEGQDLVAEVSGNLMRILGEGDLCGRYGAGRGIQALSVARWIPAIEPGRRVVANQGEYDAATRLLEESLAIERDMGDKWAMAQSLSTLAHVACSQKNYERAVTLLNESLVLLKDAESKLGIAECFERLGMVAAELGRLERAARLLGAAEALRKAVGAPVQAVNRADHNRAVARVRSGSGAERLDRAWAEGQAMTLEQAIEYALAVEPV